MSEAGKRTLSLPPHILPFVTEHLERWAGDDRVFVGRQGKPMRGDAIRQAFTRARAKIGMDGCPRLLDHHHLDSAPGLWRHPGGHEEAPGSLLQRGGSPVPPRDRGPGSEDRRRSLVSCGFERLVESTHRAPRKHERCQTQRGRQASFLTGRGDLAVANTLKVPGDVNTWIAALLAGGLLIAFAALVVVASAKSTEPPRLADPAPTAPPTAPTAPSPELPTTV